MYNLRRLWHNGLFVVAAVLILLGFWAFTMVLSVVIWVLVIAVGAVLVYFISERAIDRGAGR